MATYTPTPSFTTISNASYTPTPNFTTTTASLDNFLTYSSVNFSSTNIVLFFVDNSGTTTTPSPVSPINNSLFWDSVIPSINYSISSIKPINFLPVLADESVTITNDEYDNLIGTYSGLIYNHQITAGLKYAFRGYDSGTSSYVYWYDNTLNTTPTPTSTIPRTIGTLSNVKYIGKFGTEGINTNYALRGYDTGTHNWVYWSSTGYIETSPSVTTPSLVGNLINITLLDTF